MFARTLMSCALVLSTTTALAQSTATPPQRFVIEREIPGASKMSPEQLREAAKVSNRVLRELGPDIQWVRAFGGRQDLLRLQRQARMIRSHAENGVFPTHHAGGCGDRPTTAQARAEVTRIHCAQYPRSLAA